MTLQAGLVLGGGVAILGVFVWLVYMLQRAQGRAQVAEGQAAGSARTIAEKDRALELAAAEAAAAEARRKAAAGEAVRSRAALELERRRRQEDYDRLADANAAGGRDAVHRELQRLRAKRPAGD